MCPHVFELMAVSVYAHVWLFLESPRYTSSRLPSHLAPHRGPLVLEGAASLGLTMKGPLFPSQGYSESSLWLSPGEGQLGSPRSVPAVGCALSEVVSPCEVPSPAILSLPDPLAGWAVMLKIEGLPTS